MAAARRLVGIADGQHRRVRYGPARRGFPGIRRFGETCRSGQRPRLRPAERVSPSLAQEILIIKLGALGDFIQALGPMPDIRRHHSGDRITLLTTPRYADLAAQTSLFDDILIDRRPKALDLKGWLALRRTLRRGRFDRVLRFPDLGPDRHLCLVFPAGANAGMVRHRLAVFSPARQSAARPAAHDGPAGGAIADGGNPPCSRCHGCRPQDLCPSELAGRALCDADSRLVAAPSGEALAGEPLRRAGETAEGCRATCLFWSVCMAKPISAGRSAIVCPEAVDLVGRTDVAALAALSGGAALTVGNDTGATHVAAAGAHPVLVLFSRASDPRLCAPRGKRVHVLMEPDLADLSVEKVFAACMDVAAIPVE